MVAQRVKEALQANNIEMPTEIYTLFLKDIPEEMKSKNGAENGSANQQGTLTEV